MSSLKVLLRDVLGGGRLSHSVLTPLATTSIVLAVFANSPCSQCAHVNRSVSKIQSRQNFTECSQKLQPLASWCVKSQRENGCFQASPKNSFSCQPYARTSKSYIIYKYVPYIIEQLLWRDVKGDQRVAHTGLSWVKRKF